MFTWFSSWYCRVKEGRRKMARRVEGRRRKTNRRRPVYRQALWVHRCCFQNALGKRVCPGGVLPMWWVIHMCRGFDPLFSLWQDRARSFWGIFSHPPTPKRSFGVLKLPILTEFDLLGPKFDFSLDLFGSNFQRPAAHPHHFSDRVPPPGGYVTLADITGNTVLVPYRWIKSLQLIWRLGTCRWNLQVSHLQMGCRLPYMGKKIISPTKGLQGACCIGLQKTHWPLGDLNVILKM